MLAEMGATQWLDWKVFMTLTPFAMDRERADMRAALVAMTLWNVAIAKGTKKGHTPDYRQMHEFLMQWGDAPDPRPKKRRMTEQEQFESVVASFESLGFKPVVKA